MIFRLINKLKEIKKENYLQNKELEWAHVYHDSIRGKAWLENLPLNVGRWAGSYSLFYILNRILNDYRPESIIETGLGESSKFISSYLDHELTAASHLIIEQSPEWRDAFNSRFQLSPRSQISICGLSEQDVKGHRTNGYLGLEEFARDKFDLYLIDGPTGSPRYSRYDMVRIAEHRVATDEFIMIIDDYEREGERDSTADLLGLLEQKKIKTHCGVYEGNSTVLVIATEKYKYATSL